MENQFWYGVEKWIFKLLFNVQITWNFVWIFLSACTMNILNWIINSFAVFSVICAQSLGKISMMSAISVVDSFDRVYMIK